MAFNNTVPVTLNGVYDSGTNEITFTLTTYNLTKSTELYDVVASTKVQAIPVPLCSYKRSGGTFIIENDSQDEFQITTGWYDVVNDTHYSNVTSALDDFVDALIAQGETTGGGAAYTDISEADAKALFPNGLTAGQMYFILLDGTSQGNSGDVVAIRALTEQLFDLRAVYLHQISGEYAQVEGVFNASGWTLKKSDPSKEIDLSANYNSGTETLDLEGYEVFGVIRITATGANSLSNILGGVEGVEFRLFVTGTGGNSVGLIVGSPNIYTDTPLGSISLTDNNWDNIVLLKRGSDWIELHRATF